MSVDSVDIVSHLLARVPLGRLVVGPVLSEGGEHLAVPAHGYDDDDDDDCEGLPGVAPHVPADPQLVADVSPRAAPLALACSREVLSLVTISQLVSRYVYSYIVALLYNFTTIPNKVLEELLANTSHTYNQYPLRKLPLRSLLTFESLL